MACVARFSPTINFPENVFLTQPAYFISDQAVSDLDYLATSKDTLSLKYYYQHDPTTAPFGFSSVKGFSQHLDAGSQVASITNTQSIHPNFSVAEVFGFIREKVYGTIGQSFTPAAVGINAFGSNVFPGITIVDDLGNFSPQNTGGCPPASPCGPFNAGLNIGSTPVSQGAFTGIFQNRWRSRHLRPGEPPQRARTSQPSTSARARAAWASRTRPSEARDRSRCR